MEMTVYAEQLKQQLLATAALGGDDARALAERLVPHLDGMVRLVLLEALAAAADEITTELAPGSVSVRLRGREPEFDVVSPVAAMTSQDVTPRATVAPPVEGDDGEIARITLRLPEHLKAQVEHAATAERVSVNTWLVHAVADALATQRPGPRPTTTTSVDGQRLTGWAR